MDFYLSRKAVMLLIEQQYGITLPVRTAGKRLARPGFTLQKPIKKAYEQRPKVGVGVGVGVGVDPISRTPYGSNRRGPDVPPFLRKVLNWSGAALWLLH